MSEERWDDAELATALVTQATAMAATMREAGLVGEEKTSVSDIVTAADRAAEKHVVETLARLRPDDGVLGEEGTSKAGTSGRSWVIDPVDGTFNFFAGSAYWCSALALRDETGTILGAVNHLAGADTWVGGPGLPTTRNGNPVAPVADLPLERCSLGTYVHPPTLDNPAALDAFLAITRPVATLRMLGSGSVDLASVATGRLGCWAQHSCPEWDWLPGAALVEGAGGSTDVVEHRGLRWCLAGGPTAVGQLRELLLAS